MFGVPLGSPQDEELYERVAVLGRLRTTALGHFTNDGENERKWLFPPHQITIIRLHTHCVLLFISCVYCFLFHLTSGPPISFGDMDAILLLSENKRHALPFVCHAWNRRCFLDFWSFSNLGILTQISSIMTVSKFQVF